MPFLLSPYPLCQECTLQIGEKQHHSLCAQSFYLCLSCLGQAFYVLLLNPISIHNIETASPDDTTSAYCAFEGILKCTFDLASIIWTSLIIYSIYMSVTRNVILESKEFIYLIVGFLLPLIASIIPGALQFYGYNIYFCWFNEDNRQQQFWFKMAYFFIPLWISFIINTVLTLLTFKKLKTLGLDERDFTIFKRLMLFPLIMLITGFFATINVIYVYVNNQIIPWLQIIAVLLLSLYGFFTSLAYGFNPIIRDYIYICFNKDLQPDEPAMTETSRDTQKLQAQLFSTKNDRKLSNDI